MWIVTASSFLLLITCILSNPLNFDLNSDQQAPADAMDDFYRGLQSTFDQFIEPASQQKENFISAFADKEEGKPEIETKLKRDKNAALQFDSGYLQLEQAGLYPLHPCDTYDAASHTCSNVRQIGTTLTLGVQIGIQDKLQQPRIRWFRCYKRRGNLQDFKKEFTKDNVPWNINIGGESNELRISPVTEIDFSYNYFLVIVDIIHTAERFRRKSHNQQFMKFIIEPINVDMGTLYPGEELVIYARAFMEIPVKSVILEWSLGDVDFTVRYNLPSNMKVNADGSSVIVKELRTITDKILTCSVYSNKNVFLAKRNFLFRKIDKIGRKRPTTFETMNVRRNFKRRKKRNIDETEGFEDDEDDTANLKRYSIHSDIDKYVNKNNQDESYEDGHQQHLMYSNRLHKRNARFQNDLNQPLESLSIDNHLFYNDQDGIKSYDANYRQRNKNQYTLPKHEPFHDKDSYKMNNYASYRRNVPDQQDITNDEQNELLNDRKFDFSSRNSRFIDRQLDGPFNNKREDVSPEQLNEFTAQANRLLSENDLSNQIRDQFDESHFAEHEKYTFDDAESALIADCKDKHDCNIHANCHKTVNGKNFCKCIPEYNGNGLFCWLI